MFYSRVCNEQVTVWMEDADSAGLSVLAAPLMVRGEVAAVVYLESADPNRKFDEGHLQLLHRYCRNGGRCVGRTPTILCWLQEENERLQTELKLATRHGGNQRANCASLQRQMSKVAPSNSTGFDLGESGTGKELVAREFIATAYAPRPVCRH